MTKIFFMLCLGSFAHQALCMESREQEQRERTVTLYVPADGAMLVVPEEVVYSWKPVQDLTDFEDKESEFPLPKEINLATIKLLVPISQEVLRRQKLGQSDTHILEQFRKYFLDLPVQNEVIQQEVCALFDAAAMLNAPLIPQGFAAGLAAVSLQQKTPEAQIDFCKAISKKLCNKDLPYQIAEQLHPKENMYELLAEQLNPKEKMDELQFGQKDGAAKNASVVTAEGEPTAVAYSLNGRQLASSSTDNTIRLWNSLTGETTCTLAGHTDEAVAIAYRLDGKQLASGSSDDDIHLWNLLTKETRDLSPALLPKNQSIEDNFNVTKWIDAIAITKCVQAQKENQQFNWNDYPKTLDRVRKMPDEIQGLLNVQPMSSCLLS